MKRFDEGGELAKKGRGKNHLASMASEQLEKMAMLQDSKSSNLDQFRQKRARYGW